jgi:endogenous inhibitor of DNA gyrase (YacG/DUF329 family)
MAQTIKKCPQCHQGFSQEKNPYRPFCSERCKMIDLGNWLDEQYRIPDESGGFDSEGMEYDYSEFEE